MNIISSTGKVIRDGQQFLIKLVDHDAGYEIDLHGSDTDSAHGESGYYYGPLYSFETIDGERYLKNGDKYLNTWHYSYTFKTWLYDDREPISFREDEKIPSVYKLGIGGKYVSIDFVKSSYGAVDWVGADRGERVQLVLDRDDMPAGPHSGNFVMNPLAGSGKVVYDGQKFVIQEGNYLDGHMFTELDFFYENDEFMGLRVDSDGYLTLGSKSDHIQAKQYYEDNYNMYTLIHGDKTLCRNGTKLYFGNDKPFVFIYEYTYQR
ncbi:hypothetical protein GGI12_004853 [Dipsacomyces acuminosporus]|nr:hypothetical protein GGI12_004853 [Dipsacomyces acuminosporus]